MKRDTLSQHSARRRSVAALGLASALPASGWLSMAQAQAWPARPVRLIVPYPPGGPTDVLARIVAVKLSEALGQPFAIDNKAGASGMIGSAEVAKAAPDGYTLLGNASIHVINPSLYPKAAFDAIADFTPVTLLANVPLILVVTNDLPVKSVSDLIAYAHTHVLGDFFLQRKRHHLSNVRWLCRQLPRGQSLGKI